MAVKLNSSRGPNPIWLLTSLASRFVEVPSGEMVPPNTVANDSGSNTFEGDNPRRWHQPSTTGSRVATIGVLGINPEIGATTATIRAIIRFGLRMASLAIRALRRSRPPLRNRPADTAKRPIKVIRAGLPNRCTASSGLSTRKVTSRAAASNPVTSGASHPVTNSRIARANTAKVMAPEGSMAAVRKASTRHNPNTRKYTSVTRLDLGRLRLVGRPRVSLLAFRPRQLMSSASQRVHQASSS